MSDEPRDAAAALRSDGPDTPSKLRHELRTPINQILGYSELLQEEAEDSGSAQFVPDLRKIQQAARRMLELIDRVFTASGKQPPIDTARLRRPPSPADQTGVKLRAVDPTAAPAPGDSSGVLARGARGSVLVVDDNELNRDMLSRRLEARGYVVRVAEDGEQALRMVDANRPDAVLLDVMMPGLSGLEVLKILRDRYAVADLPVIMATARDDSEDIVAALRLGANDYVTKPLDFPVVLARLRTHLSLKKAKETAQKLAEELELRNTFIRKTFGRYLSDDVVASLLESPEGLKLGGEKRALTIMMADLRGFTQAVEHLPPETTVGLLNNYLGTMADVISRHKGTIDEFIGDAILALFGAPFPGEDDATRAVACALEMQAAMRDVNARGRALGLPPLEMGIALHTGEVVVGNIGSETRAKYGVVGSHVNLTGRLESCSVGGQILVSESCVHEAGLDVEVGKRFTINAKGFQEPIAAYELLGLGGKWGLKAPVRTLELSTLREALPVRLFLLHEKTVRDAPYDGSFVRLSGEGAVLETDAPLAPLANLRLEVGGTTIYAKVLEPAANAGWIVRFTSIPPEAAAFVAKALA